MVEILILWTYMLLVCLAAGTVTLTLLAKILPTPRPSQLGPAACVMTGIFSLTVYAETFSLFAGVGAAAHLLMLALLAAGCWFCRGEVRVIGARFRTILRSRAWLMILLFAVAVAFFTSRGKFHTDTGIYHAQAIRLIEEYGTVLGSGNLQQHFAYNSSSLCFAALFTFSRILPGAFHGTTGFLMTVLGIYAVHGLLQLRRTHAYGAAACQTGILIYILTDVYYAQSPATDYFAMLCVLFLFSEWLKGSSRRGDFSLPGYYGLLSIAAIFLVSLKLSTAAVVLLAVYPLVLLLKERKPVQILRFLLVGFLSFLPFLIRNILISGWLLYPVDSLDLFAVDWKVPAAYLRHDAAQISVWAKCLYDVNKKDWSVRQWLPVWLSGQQHYELMLIYAQFAAVLLLVIDLIFRLLRRIRIGWDRVFYYLAVAASLAVWFLEAPFIRYGLAFLFALPLTAAFEFFGMTFHELVPSDHAVKISSAAFADVPSTAHAAAVPVGRRAASHSTMVPVRRRATVSLTLGASLCLAIFLCFTSWLDHYMMDDLVFTKHHLTEPYYLTQIPFDTVRESSVDWNGITIYYSEETDRNSYWLTPSVCYRSMLDRTEPRGKTIRDGFRPKDTTADEK